MGATARDSAETRERASPSLAGHPHRRRRRPTQQQRAGEMATARHRISVAGRDADGTRKPTAGRPLLRWMRAPEPIGHAHRTQGQVEIAGALGGGPRRRPQPETWRRPVPEFRTALEWSRSQSIVQLQQPMFVVAPTARAERRQPDTTQRGARGPRVRLPETEQARRSPDLERGPSAHPTGSETETRGRAGDATDAEATAPLVQPAGVRREPRAAGKAKPAGAR